MSTAPPKPCLVANLGLGGCFVYTLAPPRRGETVVITLELPDGPSEPISGLVVHEEWSDGFGVRFAATDPDARKALRDLIDQLRTARSAR